ncbi:hypothetical protein [Dyadobacter sp. 3J3]|uniref:hypothetical protein n=1 Tax=Dyadobacter sp. 3J3 TaxID=2606600 RepID=UPI00135A9AA2|nr:hypothetical protein [Dyadobacter sp. 3J3]
MSGKLNPNYSLFTLWIFHGTLVLLLAYVNPNHYTTIDSQYYLESASNILEGHGYTILDETAFQWNGTFPAGYSLAIAFVTFLTKINVLWASKIVNIGSTGILFFFLNVWLGRNKSILIACILFLGSFLKLWAHTWSEPLFLGILFGWTYHFNQINTEPEFSKSNIIYIFLLGIGLMFVRYAGIFIIPLCLCYSVYYFWKEEKSKSLILIVLAVFWSAGFLFYILLNYQNSGELFGGVRFDGNILIAENVISFTKGLINETALFGNTTFQSIDLLFLTGISCQIFISLLIIKELKSHFALTNLNKSLFIISFFYLVFLFVLRIFSHFDEPGYRLLSPFTFFILCGIVCGISDVQITVRLKNLLVVLVVISWIEIIPKDGLKEKVYKSMKRVTHYDN